MAAFATVGLRVGRRPMSFTGMPPLREAAADAATACAVFVRAMKRVFRALAFAGVGSSARDAAQQPCQPACPSAHGRDPRAHQISPLPPHGEAGVGADLQTAC
mmetsp:Transcript_41484/g.123950  ORF Transcript_41484/g.123950 Transcript_41484/m.123950 type:complete len:103 (+) Transcript_41484:431-739(+)